MYSAKAREIFFDSYLGTTLSNLSEERQEVSRKFGGGIGFIAIADHITGLEKELEEAKKPWNSTISKAWEERYYAEYVEKMKLAENLDRKQVVIEEQEKRLRENAQEINNLKAEVKDLAESREAVRKQLKYTDDVVVSLRKENRSMDIQGYDYIGAESVGAYGSGQTYVRIWRKK